MRTSEREVGDHHTSKELAGLELLEDGGVDGRRAGAVDVCPNLATGRGYRRLAHVLHVPATE